MAKAKANHGSLLVRGVGLEQIRLKAAKRDGRAAVQLDVLQPVALHATALTVIGRPVLIPANQIPALCDALSRFGTDAPPEDFPPEAEPAAALPELEF